MSFLENIRPSKQTVALFVYVIFVQTIEVGYASYELASPPLFEFLSRIAFLGLICWWMDVDSKRNGVKWPLDLGMFLYAAWVLILPFHLLKTRGVWGLVGILCFAGAVLIASLLLVVPIILLWN